VTFEDFRSIVADVFTLDPHDLEVESRLEEDLGLDSVDRLELLYFLEDIAGHEVTDEAFAETRTMGQLFRWCEDLYDAHP
jgi:acyl carrier protein